MRLSIEWTILTRHPEGIVAETRCRAASCRPDPMIASGSVHDVLEKTAQHIRAHVGNFSQAEAWIRGERAGIRTVGTP